VGLAYSVAKAGE